MIPRRALCCFAVCFSTCCLTASAQEVVHALEGTVLNVNAKSGTISVRTDDGSGGYFQELPEPKVAQVVDKDLRGEVTPAEKFTAKGDQVVLLYEGYGDGRTAVAVHDLGNNQVTSSTGTVERYEKRTHTLTLKTDAGKDATFQVSAKTIADGPSGAVDGMKFEPSKGDHVKVTAAPENGTQMAMFVGPAE